LCNIAQRNETEEAIMSEHEASPLARRSFLSQVGTGVTVVGAAAAAGATPATAQTGTRWQPARHEQDDWLESVPGKHRFVFDTTTPGGMSSALLYAGNYYNANATGYGLRDEDLAVVIVARHTSTAFAYNETIWSKYGEPISAFTDRNREPSKTNAYARQIDGLIRRGAHFAVCQMASRALAGSVARAVGASPEDIYNEIAANLVGNSHFVTAGIVLVNRAQERGYSFVFSV
jgi:hypothetical protein